MSGIAIGAAAIGAFGSYAGGGGWWSGGDKKSTIGTHVPEGYKRLQDLLYSRESGGYPELKNLWQQEWGRGMEDINEELRGKRGFGPMSTPEYAQKAKYGAGLMENMGRMDLQGRLQALQLLTQTEPTPFGYTTQGTIQQQPNYGQMIGPLLASMNQGQQQPMVGGANDPRWANQQYLSGFGQSPGQQLQPQSIGSQIGYRSY